MQALDAWLDRGHDACQRALANAAKAGQLAPPLDAALEGVKLNAKQRRALQEFRDLYVVVRSEAARYGPDRCTPSCPAVVLGWRCGVLRVGVGSCDALGNVAALQQCAERAQLMYTCRSVHTPVRIV